MGREVSFGVLTDMLRLVGGTLYEGRYSCEGKANSEEVTIGL